MPTIVSSQGELKTELDARGVVVGLNRLPTLFRDGCPGETGAYDVDRVIAWLIEKGIHKPEPEPATPASEIPEEDLPEAAFERHHIGPCICQYCFTRVDVLTIQDSIFQHFEKCKGCGNRPPKRQKMRAIDLVKHMQDLTRRRPAVERP